MLSTLFGRFLKCNKSVMLILSYFGPICAGEDVVKLHLHVGASVFCKLTLGVTSVIVIRTTSSVATTRTCGSVMSSPLVWVRGTCSFGLVSAALLRFRDVAFLFVKHLSCNTKKHVVEEGPSS